ncbi:MAG: hypothetical protein JSV78_05510 [Phycisphaerales bacterium]|nr:MAG: hypothetical protein JSV78_05510 [Phycisphaerales bacterium]
MLKLNAGFSRKVGEANYGSRGASVNVELELESRLIGDPDALATRIRNLFDLARRSVDAELAGNNGNGSASDGTGRWGNGQDRSLRYATASQLRAIRAICNRIGRDPVQVANERFKVNDLDELTLQEASTLIDALKSNSRREGGGR